MLWTVDLPFNGYAVSPSMAVTGTGVAFSFLGTLLIYDGEGHRVATVSGAQTSSGRAAISSPVSGADGSVFFADAAYAYRVDGSGKMIWRTPIGAGGGSAGHPALADNGQLYVPAGDGTLRVLRSIDGGLISTFSIGLLNGGPRWIYGGVGSALFIDKDQTGTTASEGVLSLLQGTWVGNITVGPGKYPPGSLLGYDIGVVISAYVDDNEKAEVDVLDRCGNLRWKVPGEYAVPLAITFDDDLIVMDRVPNGRSAPFNHDFTLRRFSKDGALVAGPVSVRDAFCGRAFVGADDTFYYTAYSNSADTLTAFDPSLNVLWTIPFPSCANAAVLNSEGKLFAAEGIGGKLAAVQTTSPGPAPVSWSQVDRDARATDWLAP